MNTLKVDIINVFFPRKLRKNPRIGYIVYADNDDDDDDDEEEVALKDEGDI